MNDVLSLFVGVVVVLAITALTAYFVAQEFTYMSVDRSRLRARAQAGDETVRRALEITRRTSFLLSGAQLGITVTGLLVGHVAEPLIGVTLSSMLGGVGIFPGIGLTLGGLAAIIFSTFVQMLLGELWPKNYAVARPGQVSGALARSSSTYLLIFGPRIAGFDKSAEMLLRRLGIEPVHDVEQAATAAALELNAGTALREALRTMRESRHQHAVVTDEAGFRGVVTVGDALPSLLPRVEAATT